MGKAGVNTEAEARPIAPPKVPDLAAQLIGYVKVRLNYLTTQPQHLRSILLQHTYGIKPPYTEEVCVLLPSMKVFALLETFIPAFEHLQKSGVLPKTTELQGFDILDEDNLTLAYVF